MLSSRRSAHASVAAATLLALLLGACAPQDDFEREFFAFGTVVNVSIYDSDSESVSAAMRELQQYAALVGRDWYPWTDGALQTLNDALANGESAQVDEDLAALIQRAADYERISGGRFNAGLGRLSELWGFPELPQKPAELPPAGAIDALLAAAPAASKVQWTGTMAATTTRDVMLDLGGIAKGALLQKMAAILAEHGIDNAIINIGGDLLVSGSVNGRHARIGIRSPDSAQAVAGLEIESGEAVFTSGNYERYVEIDGRRYTHILDPATGYPVDHTSSVTVVSQDPLLADAAATALMVGGADNFDALVAAFELRYAMLLGAGGDVRLTSQMAERLHWRNPQQSQ